VRSFYTRHHVPIEKLQGGRRAYVERPHKALTEDEIRELLKVAAPREKALIWFLYTSGARIDSVLKLNYGRIDWSAKPPLRVHFYPAETKNNVEYDTFIASEAVDAMKQYFNWRRRQGKKIDKDSALFIGKYDKPLKYHGAYKAIKKTILMSKVTFDKKRERLAHHSFRAAFQRRLQISGVNQVIIEKMRGHSQNTTTARYSRGLTVEDLRREYLKADWSLGESIKDEVEELRSQLKAIQSILPERLIQEIHANYKPLGEPKPHNLPGLPQIRAFIPPTEEESVEIAKNVIKKIIENPRFASAYEDKYDELVMRIKELEKRLKRDSNDYRYEKIDATDEARLLELLNNQWEIYKEINGSIILRKTY